MSLFGFSQNLDRYFEQDLLWTGSTTSALEPLTDNQCLLLFTIESLTWLTNPELAEGRKSACLLVLTRSTPALRTFFALLGFR